LRQPIAIAAWDRSFDRGDPSLSLPQNGKVGESMNLLPTASATDANPHGRYIASILTENRPYVSVFPVMGLFSEWQDPELCLLINEPAFAGKLPSCRAAAEDGMRRISQFIKASGARYFNISWGTYFPWYMKSNPRLLRERFPDIKLDLIKSALRRNFDAINELFATVVADNPQTLFVAAAGSYDGDNDFPPTPCAYGNLSTRFDNFIAVTATEDGELIEENSNIGVKSVDYAVLNGGLTVLGEIGKRIAFGGTSAAPPLNIRAFADVEWLTGRMRSPREIKALARASVRHVDNFAKMVATSGIFDEELYHRSF
jgi:hypothetical protein